MGLKLASGDVPIVRIRHLPTATLLALPRSMFAIYLERV